MSTAPEFPVTATGYQSVLSAIIERTVGPQAVEIDRTGAFPRDSVRALRDAGLLGLLSAPQVGGGGEALAAGAHVIEAVGARCPSTAAAHLARSRLQHLEQTLAEQPVSRAAFARLRIRTDGVRALLRDTLAALSAGRDDAMLRVLEVKAVAAEAAVEVADFVLRLCGGAAFRKELGVERLFRDALAARVMAPTTDALHDFVGRVCLGLPLFDAPDAPDA